MTLAELYDVKVYVGTYAKYNNDSLAGRWLTLSDYRDHEEFIEACYDLHADEAQPELMYLDFDVSGIHPRGLDLCENIVSVELWVDVDPQSNKRIITALLEDGYEISEAVAMVDDCYIIEGDNPIDLGYELLEHLEIDTNHPLLELVDFTQGWTIDRLCAMSGYDRLTYTSAIYIPQ